MTNQCCFKLQVITMTRPPTRVLLKAQMDSHCNTISKVFATEPFNDVRIHCKNQITLGANKIVLAGSSKFLASIFSAESGIESYIGLSFDLVCKHFEPEAMKKVLDLICTGSALINLKDKNIIDNMKCIVKSLKVDNLLHVLSNIPSAKENSETILNNDSSFLTPGDVTEVSEENLEVNEFHNLQNDLKLEQKIHKNKEFQIDKMNGNYKIKKFQTKSNSETPNKRLKTILVEEIHKHACSICQETFISESDLEAHSDTHKADKFISEMTKGVQKNIFVLRNKRKRLPYHQKQGLEKPTKSMKIYPCVICGLPFQTANKCAIHWKLHYKNQRKSNLENSSGVFTNSQNKTVTEVDLTDGEDEQLSQHNALNVGVCTENIKEISLKPEENTGKPEEKNRKPKANTGKPEENTGKPKGNTGKPEENTGKPEENTGKPEENTGKTEENTSKTEENTGKPENNTEKLQKHTSLTEKVEEVYEKPALQTCQICQRHFVTSFVYKMHLKSHNLEPFTSKGLVNDTEEIPNEPDFQDKAFGEICLKNSVLGENLPAENTNESYPAMITDIKNDEVDSQPSDKSPCSKQLFSCKFCQIKFSGMPHLEEHLKNHIATPFKCQICKQVFSCSIKLENHQKKLHKIQKTSSNSKDNTISVKSTQSKIKSKTKVFVKNLKKPRTGISQKNTPAYKEQNARTCHLCQERCYNQTVLLRHLGIKHYREEVEKYFGDKNGECGLCKKILSKRCSLIRHIVLEHNVLSKLLNFEEEAMLDGNKCPFTPCPSTYSVKRHFLTHLATTHYRREMEALFGKGKLQCGLCQITCTSENNLMSHLANVHQAIQKFKDLKVANSNSDPANVS